MVPREPYREGRGAGGDGEGDGERRIPEVLTSRGDARMGSVCGRLSSSEKCLLGGRPKELGDQGGYFGR